MQITIARAMTRKKTIKAQLDKITKDISQHGAINNKRLHILSDEKKDIKKNHQESIDKVKALFQQFYDLKDNYIKLTVAINKANLETDIVITGKTMKIAEALVYKNDIQAYFENLKFAYQKAVSKATAEVDQFNKNMKTEGLSEQVKKEVLADVLYLVPIEKMDELDAFLVEFMTEIDGTLNEVNARTFVEVDID
ncbi:hypothetical protein [Bacillus mesophilum]|uniref:Uncharacterized protein n=1 Tax=Bacillus mesophilum TaxID=1071718 RepID=A0A7V7RIV3_9BACI|nr:hypothetical protein [Bacillus mesophilum]KAB2328895.1 hypothetical protein F7732_22250 [Bacillus mesophilum]